MARLKSEDKRNAILAGAVDLFADRGLNAPTAAAIAAAAGIAEGTLFTYFNTKDELINILFQDLKLDLAGAMMSAFPRKTSVRHRLQHVWDRYVDWGIENPLKQKVLKQIEVWGGLTEESRAAGLEPFLAIQTLTEHAIEQRILHDLPQRFLAGSISALADMTMELIRQDPSQAEVYRSSGFAMFWAGIARKS